MYVFYYYSFYCSKFYHFRQAEPTWTRYNGVKLTCYDKDLIGSPDFMGEVYLWFDEDLPGPTTLDKKFDVELKSRPRKGDKVSGHLTIRSSFECKAPKSTGSDNKRATVKPATSVAVVVNSELVQLSSTGRKEVKIKTSGVEKFISFSELPKFDTTVKDQAQITKEERKYGFNTNIALWLVTSCQLAYKNEDIVNAVCLNVWGKFTNIFIIFFFIFY